MKNLTVKEIANLPTTGKGELKSKVFTTRLANDIESGDLVVNSDQTITYNNINYAVSYDSALATALTISYRTDTTMTDLLELMDSNYISLQQRAIAESGVDRIPSSSNDSVQSLSSYMTRLVTANLTNNLDSIVENLLQTDVDAMTKSEVLAAYKSLVSLLITPEQVQKATDLQAIELENRERLSKLKELPLQDVKLTSHGFTGHVSIAEAADVLAELDTLGFYVNDSTVNTTTMLMKLCFNEKTSDSEITI